MTIWKRLQRFPFTVLAGAGITSAALLLVWANSGLRAQGEPRVDRTDPAILNAEQLVERAGCARTGGRIATSTWALSFLWRRT